MPTNQGGQAIIFRGGEREKKLSNNKLDHYQKHTSHQQIKKI